MDCRVFSFFSGAGFLDLGFEKSGVDVVFANEIYGDFAYCYRYGIKGSPDAIDVAKHIDCIWFNGGMPFVFEVEHSTGVTSGLCRMNKLRERSHIDTDYVIVAPDADRQMVLQKANSTQFEDMRLWYMPYSHLIEMSDFAAKHPYRGNSRARGSFAKMFMEEINA
ncbi:MAG: DNA cytosine methyltransferase [Akkermansia sp.]|nr:DNA cytosine methyltransferase [Akkermansia sp.]